MAQGTQRPASLPAESRDTGTPTAAESSTPSLSHPGGLPESARRLRAGSAWRDRAGLEWDRGPLTTEEVADGLARARLLYRHPRMQRLARRSA